MATIRIFICHQSIQSIDAINVEIAALPKEFTLSVGKIIFDSDSKMNLVTWQSEIKFQNVFLLFSLIIQSLYLRYYCSVSAKNAYRRASKYNSSFISWFCDRPWQLAKLSRTGVTCVHPRLANNSRKHVGRSRGKKRANFSYEKTSRNEKIRVLF